MKIIARFKYILLLLLFVLLLSACKNDSGTAAKSIEDYIRALSAKDSVKISNLSCAEWEQEALLEVDSLTAVGSTVMDLSCTQINQNSSEANVSCSGSLDLDYNGEAQQIDLSTRTYIAKQEDGEWRMCGYR